jgi:hypothetical protein
MENKIEDLTQQQRLGYLIYKYFNTRVDFCKEAEILPSALSNHLTSKTQKISKYLLRKIEKNVGFSSEFILRGDGDEFVEGRGLQPTNQFVKGENIPKKMGKIHVQQPNRGEAESITLGTSGRKMILTDKAMINVVDIAFDGLLNPLIIKVTNLDFCKKYKLKFDSAIVIDKDNYDAGGDIVFVEGYREYYICELINNKLVDLETAIEYDIKEVSILGMVYSKIERF